VLGELDPVRAMMQGKLRVRGDLPTIVRYVKAADELVHLCSKVPTTFPDEG
jgi:putative sterol carrier protein